MLFLFPQCLLSSFPRGMLSSFPMGMLSSFPQDMLSSLPELCCLHPPRWVVFIFRGKLSSFPDVYWMNSFSYVVLFPPIYVVFIPSGMLSKFPLDYNVLFTAQTLSLSFSLATFTSLFRHIHYPHHWGTVRQHKVMISHHGTMRVKWCKVEMIQTGADSCVWVWFHPGWCCITVAIYSHKLTLPLCLGTYQLMKGCACVRACVRLFVWLCHPLSPSPSLSLSLSLSSPLPLSLSPSLPLSLSLTLSLSLCLSVPISL